MPDVRPMTALANSPASSSTAGPPPASSLEEMVAERIADHAARIAEERVREAFSLTEFDPDEVLGPHGLQGGRRVPGPPTTPSGRSRRTSPATR